MTRKSNRSKAAIAIVIMAGAWMAFSVAIAQDQTEFTVTLTDVGADKVEVLKRLRAVTGLSLFEAKDVVDGVPKKIKERASKSEATQIKNELEKAGAKVEVK